jgi:hypothetical protein
MPLAQVASVPAAPVAGTGTGFAGAGCGIGSGACTAAGAGAAGAGAGGSAVVGTLGPPVPTVASQQDV